MIKTRLIATTVPVLDDIPDGQALIAYCARVSNPQNQDNHETGQKLLNYCIRNKHWSVFEMANAVVEVEAPRDISRQVIRHASFRFQEFSQRYSDQIEFTTRDIRAQDPTNRQNSVDEYDEATKEAFRRDCEEFAQASAKLYFEYLAAGVAKECARVFLPEGLTMSRFYMNGTLRSWLHYLDIREGNGTQLEHQWLAKEVREVLAPAFPDIIRSNRHG